jgi:hypothetical protein
MAVRGRPSAAIVLGLLLPVTAAVSQDGTGPVAADSAADQSEGFPLSGLVTVFAPILLPKFAADTYRLREFVCSEEFAEVRARLGDLAAVDTLFFRAKEFSWGNLYEALLISALATLDHRRVGVHVPLAGPLLWLPLTSEFDDDFRSRLAALPRRLYPDSPADSAGDRDKLQHFFGSAFLAAVSESRDAAGRVGDFVEWGEELFIVGGVADPRDVRANRQGQEFGLHVLAQRGERPSKYLRRGSTKPMSIEEAPSTRESTPRGARQEEP